MAAILKLKNKTPLSFYFRNQDAKHVSFVTRPNEYGSQLMNINFLSVYSSHPMQGTLNKYTNVVKGWQNRWFVLDPQRGSLEYYVVSR